MHISALLNFKRQDQHFLIDVGCLFISQNFSFQFQLGDEQYVVNLRPISKVLSPALFSLIIADFCYGSDGLAHH